MAFPDFIEDEIELGNATVGFPVRPLVHRDLKPENIFVIKDLGDRELVKIVDFGIATQSVGGPAGASDTNLPAMVLALSSEGSHGQALTQVGALIGTPAYMAPEQIVGTGLDQRADQYALGCILHELCTKELPFDGLSLAQLLNQHLYSAVTPLRERYPRLGLPPELDELVLRLLAKEPAGRFASIEEVESALTQLQGRLAPAADARAQRGRRWPLWLGAAGLSVALLSAGAYVVMHATGRATSRHESPLAPGELSALRAAALEVTQWFLASAALPLRLGAIVAIGQTHDEATLPLLLPLLADPLPAVQAQAAEVIGQIGDPAAAGALFQLLATPRPAVVAAAVGIALDQLGDGRGRETLERMLKSPQPEAQFRAALALCQRGDSAATARLQALLAAMNAPAELEQRALGCLALRGDDVARQRLLDKLRGPLHPKLKLSPAGELAELGDDEARRFLHELASNPGPEQLLAGQWVSGAEEQALLQRSRQVLADPGAELNARALAAGNLGTGGDLWDVRRLVPHLRTDSAELSLASAGALLQLAASDPSLLSTRSSRFVALAGQAGDWSLRQSAATVLGDSVKSEDALTQLGRLQGDGDARVRRGVARALGRRPEYDALLALHPLLRDADALVRSEALSALLRQLRTQLQKGPAQLLQTVAPWLQELLEHGTPAEEAQARALLLQLGQTAQRPALRELLEKAPPALRLLVMQNVGNDVELLTRGLADGDFAVRLAAARALALQKDRRAIPVLKEALGRGGAAALLGFGLLRRLGENQPLPADMERTLRDKDPVVRSQAVESAATLPLEQALAVLRRATRDPAVPVRQSALEVAAELKDDTSGALPGVFILRLLIADSDAAVRARAAALLARVTLASEAGSGLLLKGEPAPAQVAAEPAPVARDVTPAPAAAADGGTDLPTPPDAGAALTGSLLLEGTAGTPVQLDRGAWLPLGKSARTLPAGQHVVAYLDGEQTVLVTPEQTVRVTIPPSPVEKLTSLGQELAKKSELGKAQKQLERAGQLCSRDRRYAVMCAVLKPRLALALGQAYEGQDRLAEAMGEYEKALGAADAGGPAADRAAAQAAVKRLADQLGQVVIPKQGKNGCVEDRMWMPPGTHTVKVDGQGSQVKVRAHEIVRVGECK